jgi:hypothetical protein
LRGGGTCRCKTFAKFEGLTLAKRKPFAKFKGLTLKENARRLFKAGTRNLGRSLERSRLRSWDRFYLPLPFSRVRMRREVPALAQRRI